MGPLCPCFSYPEEDGEPVWACDPQQVDLIDPNFDHQV